MTTRVLNFLWLNLDIPAPPDPDENSIHAPLPEKYLSNLLKHAQKYPDTEYQLWVDSKRLTNRQIDYLRTTLEQNGANICLKDLRDIPAYDQEPLYNRPETNSKWRSDSDKNSTIWLQVDAAKVLISLQGNADQTFFADFDFAHLNVKDKSLQKKLAEQGMFIGTAYDWFHDRDSIENQLWGFTKEQRLFFETYYQTVLEQAYQNKNGWHALLKKIDSDDLKISDFAVYEQPIGSCATQPGHAFRTGKGKKTSPAILTLTDTFNKKNLEIQKPAERKKHAADLSLKP